MAGKFERFIGESEKGFGSAMFLAEARKRVRVRRATEQLL